MYANIIQQCPHCNGAIPREEFVTAELDDREIVFQHCTFCQIVTETEKYDDGQVFALDYHQRTEPKSYSNCLIRMDEARAA